MQVAWIQAKELEKVIASGTITSEKSFLTNKSEPRTEENEASFLLEEEMKFEENKK